MFLPFHIQVTILKHSLRNTSFAQFKQPGGHKTYVENDDVDYLFDFSTISVLNIFQSKDWQILAKLKKNKFHELYLADLELLHVRS
jgi:hypothetical protein